KLLPHFAFQETERPIVAQIFGNKPEQFFECAQLIKELGFDGIDINMGCPDRKVLKQGAGIALCKTPELAREIIEATKQGAGDIPVSVKTRLGYHEIDFTWIQNILDANIAAFLIHLRTMKEMSKVPAHWEYAKEIADMAHATHTVVVGNGDVSSYLEGIEKAQQSGLDGIMVGRGIFHNPWIFSPDIDPAQKTLQERIELCKRHILLFTELWGEHKNYDVLKRFYKIYIHGWPDAKDLRDQLMQTKSAPEALGILARFQTV
ncbi:MAG TPA: tRNA-dihydrouridine synthase, partial [Candidatus Paceibacterota bacterium]|nr:tRNA-dihydrouridine synthase [Candidatus Paceibacterota bacterium]